MLKYILVPLDGSPLAEAALRPAMVLARRFDAELLLVRTVFDSDPPEPIDQPTRFTAAPDAQSYLDTVAASLNSEGVVARTSLLPMEPAEGIADEAGFSNVDLIVMTTHQRKGLDALLHPSITWQVFRQHTAPILACKCAGTRDPTTSLPRFMTDPHAPMVVPLDGSLEAEAVLPLAQELARAFGNPLLLVRAAEQPYIAVSAIGYPMLIAEASKWSQEEAESYLKRKRLELASAGLMVDIECALAPAAQFIEQVAQEHRAGLIVLASHGRGWLGQLMLGSVAKSVLNRTELPILLVRRRSIETGASQPSPSTPKQAGQAIK
jgi:nucleotide-binding universal stress UspA family protein